ENVWPASGPWTSDQPTGKEIAMADEPFAAYQNQQLLMLAAQGRVLSDAERTRLTPDQLMILHAMGQRLSAQDRTRLAPAQLMWLTGQGQVLSDAERARLTPEQLMIL